MPRPRFCAAPAALTLMLAAWTGAAGAAEPAATIVVTGERVIEAEARAPTGAVTVIDASVHAEQGETVTDALAESVGVQVRRFGGLGAFSTVSIRGSSPNHVQVYLDGIPLSRGRTEVVNLADLPLDSLERLEVYRGVTPVEFGAAGIGGVVNLATKPPSAAPATEIAASYGSFSTRKLVVSRTQRIGPVDALGHVSYLGSEGDFSFFDDNGTPLNPGDDGWAARRNNSFDAVDTLLKAAYAPGADLRVDLTSETFFKEQGLPGTGSNQSAHASAGELRSLHYLRARHSGWLRGALEATGTLFGVYEREEFDDRRGELFGAFQLARNETVTAGGSAAATYGGAAGHLPGAFVQLAYERLSPSDALASPSEAPDQDRLHLTVSAQDQVSLRDELLLLVPTVRYERLRDAAGGTAELPGMPPGPAVTRETDLWSPSLGAQVRPLAWLAVKGNIGLYERAPNFGELFGNRGFVRGNPALLPERGTNRDIGAGLSLDRAGLLRGLHVEYVYFNNDIERLIVFQQTAQSFFRPVNASAARLRGHELSAGAAWRGVAVEANYTRQDAENLTPAQSGKRLPLRPADEVFARLEVSGEPGEAYYEFNLVSGNYLNFSNFDRVPARDTHTLGAAVKAGKALRVGLEARNLTDNRISDVAGFPLPGRFFFGTAAVKF